MLFDASNTWINEKKTLCSIQLNKVLINVSLIIISDYFICEIIIIATLIQREILVFNVNCLNIYVHE